MADPKLRLVNPGEMYELGTKPETVAEHARRLHTEAQILACEDVDVLRVTLGQALQQAEAIRDSDLYPVGVREQARQLTQSLPLTMQTLQALCQRHLQELVGGPKPPIWKLD